MFTGSRTQPGALGEYREGRVRAVASSGHSSLGGPVGCAASQGLHLGYFVVTCFTPSFIAEWSWIGAGVV